MDSDQEAVVKFEICLRAEVGRETEKSRAMAIIAFKKDANGISCRQEAWRPRRGREETATGSALAQAKEPVKEKLVDLVLSKLIPPVNKDPVWKQLMEADSTERAVLLKDILQQWLQNAAMAVAEERRVDIGEVRAVYGVLGEEMSLEAFFGVAVVTGVIKTPEEMKASRFPPGVTVAERFTGPWPENY